MRILLNVCGVVTAIIALSATAPSAVAQGMYNCQDVGWGGGPPEPLGDREGHGITVNHYSCRVDSGPMSGAVATGTDIYEWDGPKGVERANVGVARKPGATVMYQDTGGNFELTMVDGKVTGWTASGKGVNLIATGSAASLAGKPYAWTAKPTGPMTWTVDSIEGKQ